MAIIHGERKSARQNKASIDWYKVQSSAVQYYQQSANENWREVFVPVMDGVMTQQGELMRSSFGYAFDVPNIGAQTWFNDYTLQFAQPINQTSSDEMSNMFQQAQNEGWTIGQMEDHLEEMFVKWMDGDGTKQDWEWYQERMPAHRLEMIARTESMRSSNYGNFWLMSDWGVEKKEWLATADDRTRDTHIQAWVDYSGDGAIAMLDSFVVGGATLDYPGDPYGPPEETINCRCTVIPFMQSSETNDTPWDDNFDAAQEFMDSIQAGGFSPENIVSQPDRVWNAFTDDMKHDWFVRMQGLADEDKQLFKKYTGSGYSDYNNYLRRGPENSGLSAEYNERVKAEIEKLQSAYSRNKLVADEDIIAYRGFGGGWIDESFVKTPDLLIDTELTDKGFTSTAVSEGSMFSNTFIAEVRIPKGTPGAYIDSISNYPGELEFLLAPGTRFRVVDATSLREGRQAKLILEVIP